MIISVFSVCVMLGCLAGFLAGLLGIGGGLVIVPALAFFLPLFGFDTELVMPVAIATSLSSIIFTTFSSSLAHHRNKNIPWQVSRQLMVMVAIGAMLGAYIADSLSSDVLTYIFAGAVLLLASYMLLSIKVEKEKPLPKPLAIKLIGLSTGTISSIMGIGGGAILVPTLTYFSLPIRQSIGTASVCGLVVAIFGAIGFVLTGLDLKAMPEWSLGYVYLPALLGIILTSSLFAPLGVKWASKLPVNTLKKVFAGFLILVAIKMVWH